MDVMKTTRGRPVDPFKASVSCNVCADAGRPVVFQEPGDGHEDAHDPCPAPCELHATVAAFNAHSAGHSQTEHDAAAERRGLPRATA